MPVPNPETIETHFEQTLDKPLSEIEEKYFVEESGSADGDKPTNLTHKF